MHVTRTVLPPSIQYADGVVYAGSSGVYALGARDGSLRRRYAGVGSDFAVRGDLLVTAQHTEHGLVRALRLSDGAEVWRFVTGARPSEAPVVADDTVYVGVIEGWLLALSAADGAVRWRYDCGPIVCDSPTVAGDRVYIAPAVNAPDVPAVVALDAATGHVLWRAEMPDSTTKALTVAGDLVFAATHSGCVALDVRDGAVRWSYPIEGGMVASPAVREGSVYLTYALWRHEWDEEDQLIERHEAFALALDAADGARIWQAQIGREAGVRHVTTPAVSGDTVYLGADDGRLYALAAGSGAVRWTFKIGGDRLSAPVLVDGTVYAGANDGFVYALDAATAQPLWRTYTDTATVAVAGISIISGSIGAAEPEQK